MVLWCVDVIMNGDVVCAVSGEVREDMRVNPCIFEKNKNVLVMTLAFHIKSVGDGY